MTRKSSSADDCGSINSTLYYKAEEVANAFFPIPSRNQSLNRTFSASEKCAIVRSKMKSAAKARARQLNARTRATYEKYPYPAADRSSLRTKRWNLAPMEWIMALWRPGNEEASPKRILVAGCGSGSEAFMLARKFPAATIVAVDFSSRSIAIAKKLQRESARMRNIRFLEADLTSRSLSRTAGSNFDFISCHGVLSYIPNPERVLAKLARQLKPDGALFLGVNGSEHFSVRGRPFLSSFGFDLAELREEARLRELLGVWDRLLESYGGPRLPNKGTGYLAGDLFGPLFHNWSLARWARTARNAGLHLSDSYSCWRKRRSLMEGDNALPLMPRSRADVSLLLDVIVPEMFHRLLFAKQKPWNPPWENHQALLNSRPILSRLYSLSIPRRSRTGRRRTKATLKSRVLNTRLDWKLPEWEAEILRQSDGRRTLREILHDTAMTAPRKVLREQLYIMYQLLVLSLTP
jgi:SAM-dependent methyltransferase